MEESNDITSRLMKLIKEQDELIRTQQQVMKATVLTLEGLSLNSEWQKKKIRDLANELKTLNTI
jgi:hypothetical protein